MVVKQHSTLLLPGHRPLWSVPPMEEQEVVLVSMHEPLWPAPSLQLVPTPVDPPPDPPPPLLSRMQHWMLLPPGHRPLATVP